ncbi:PIN domain-containing protein [Citromicrobium bathyomarinum]
MLMTERRRVYWDACAWLGLISGEPDKATELEVVWRKAERGEVEIWTSAFCIAEVYKVKCEKGRIGLSPEYDAQIDNLFDQDFVHVTQVDIAVARLAKKMLRGDNKLKKPSDGIHLATAMIWNVDQLHTYDDSDLLGLAVSRLDGEPLEICRPDMIDGEHLFNLRN